MNLNIFEACRAFGVRKLLCCLSTCIFPDATPYPLTEGMLHAGPPHPSNASYAHAKRMVDVLARAYATQYGLQCACLVPTNVYGPHDNFSLEDGHVLPALIHRCHAAQASGGDFVVWGSGTPVRQFILSADLAALTLWALRSYHSSEPLILSPGPEAEVSIAQAAAMVAAGLGFTGRLLFDASKADGQQRKTASNSRLLALHPGAAFTPMQQGVAETCQWFKEHHATARK